ncbi:hypothetical protein FB192DRAFT_1078549 [Mucor lusitanicus]|uniref:Uncharacterized protein n=2 Tax=Mucor circinelloides f. lusitanicus TaxID=29924 RepID=A0A162U1D2_MUCCL|nr:hypothetical protein FB192DRAFT_1078549 [Mucor lusitanicus]OAD08722.1 hypothetical protein MUCCIDRAFT_105692 [Mucor lusitanicus CBS 277.49]
MSSLPSPPPSPLDHRRHRRSDSFALLQAIIKEREKEEHQEEEMMIKSRLLRFSCPPSTMNQKSLDSTNNAHNASKDIIIPHKSLSHHSVRFTTEPPKVYHYN